MALVALVGIGIAVASSGGGSGGASTEPLASNPPSGNQTTTNPQNQQNSQNSQNTKPQPNRLSKTELTAALDGNCRKAQAAFDQVQAKYQAGGLSLVEYTQGRFNNSADQLQRLGRIVPPKDLQTEFDRYAALITQVHGFDREARDAATRNDPAAVDAAYAKIDNQLNQRHELAVKLGSTICNPLPA